MTELENNIKSFIEEEISPYLNSDGGDCEFLSFDQASGTVRLSLQGSCESCQFSSVTLKMGIERRLTEQFPEIKKVEVPGLKITEIIEGECQE